MKDAIHSTLQKLWLTASVLACCFCLVLMVVGARSEKAFWEQDLKDWAAYEAAKADPSSDRSDEFGRLSAKFEGPAGYEDGLWFRPIYPPKRTEWHHRPVPVAGMVMVGIIALFLGVRAWLTWMFGIKKDPKTMRGTEGVQDPPWGMKPDGTPK